MITAIVSMNAVVSHCPTLGCTPKSTWRTGMAMLITVSLRITTKLEKDGQDTDHLEVSAFDSVVGSCLVVHGGQWVRSRWTFRVVGTGDVPANDGTEAGQPPNLPTPGSAAKCFSVLTSGDAGRLSAAQLGGR